MADTRSAFSVPLCLIFQALIVLGYTLRPSPYRSLLFIPIVVISGYLMFFTTGAGAVANVGLGGALATQTIFAFDGIVLTDVQKSLNRIGEKPGGIIFTPFSARLLWAWQLYNSPRGVRWTHELRHIPQNPLGQTKRSFLLSRILAACSLGSVQGGFMIVNQANSALVPGAIPLLNQPLYVRALSLFGFGIPAYCQIQILHCVMSIVLVSTGISEPVDWPPLFGSPARMYSVQGFWRNVWHQMLRRPILTIANFLLHIVLRLPHPSSPNSRSSVPIGLLKLHTAFLVSALVHFCGEFMMSGHGGLGAFYFFILQPWAITFEIAVRYLITGSTYSMNGDKPPPMIWRVLGYVWVISWFIAVSPLMQQPMTDAGVFVGQVPESNLTRMVGRCLALDVI